MPKLKSVAIDIKNVHLSRPELAQRLQTPVEFESELLDRCELKLKEICRPKCCFAEVNLKLMLPNVVDCGVISFNSNDLYKNLKNCSRAYIMAVTLGFEVDRAIAALKVTSPAECFVFDALASAYADAAADYASELLCGGHRLRPRYSPGYGDLSLEVQAEVLKLLNADMLLGIKLGNNLLMTPRKSITAIQGVEQ